MSALAWIHPLNLLDALLFIVNAMLEELIFLTAARILTLDRDHSLHAGRRQHDALPAASGLQSTSQARGRRAFGGTPLES